MADRFAYTIGGTVQASSGTYIRRGADEQLLQHCLNGKYAYILSARQVGKSSLMVNVARELRQRGVQAATVDLTAIGRDQVDAEAWYCGILYEIERKLSLGGDVFAWWEKQNKLTLSSRFIGYLRDVILPQIPGRLIVFLDEIDTTLSLKFTDDFFAAIRMLYNMRAEEPSLQRLSFVLIGVAVPMDLIKHPRRTPFNIAEHVDLEDFSHQEARPLVAGLAMPESPQELILDQVLHWTGGHPYLTQRLLRAIADEDRPHWERRDVDLVVEKTFLGDQSALDSNLEHVGRRLAAPTVYSYRMLSIYASVLRGLPPVLDNDRNLVKSYLKLSGVVRRKGAFLVIRNRIYERVFNTEWVKEQRAVRQERAARGAILAAGLVSLVAVGLAIFSGMQRREIERSREDATREHALRAEAEKQRIAAEQAQQQSAEALVKEKQAKDQAEAQTTIATLKTQEAEASRQEAEAALNAEAEQADRAKRAAQDADEQRKLAEKNYLEAQAAAQEAQVQKQAAETNLKAAVAARTGEQEKAQQLVGVYLGLKLVPDADLLRLQEPDRAEDGMLLDIEAYRRTPSVETQQALRSGLDKLLKRVATLPSKGEPGRIALSPDSSILAVESPDGTVQSYGLPDLHPGGTLSARGQPKFLAVTSAGITAADSTGPLRSPHQPDLPLNETVLAVSPDGTLLATVAADGKRVRYWRNGQSIGVAKHSGKVILARFRSGYLDTLTDDYLFSEWLPFRGGMKDASRFQLPKDMPRPSMFAHYAGFGSNQGIAVVSGQTVRIFDEHPNFTRGRTIFSGVRLTYRGQQYAILQHDGPITGLAIDPVNRFIATASSDRTARLWNLTNGQEIARVKLDQPVVSMVLGGDGRAAAVMEKGGAVTVFSTEPGSAVARSAAGSQSGLGFLPDGNRIALLGQPSSRGPDRVWNWPQDHQTLIDSSNNRTGAALSSANSQRLEVIFTPPTQTAGGKPAASPAAYFTQTSNLVGGAVVKLGGSSSLRTMAISSAGHFAAVIDSNGLRVYETDTGKAISGFDFQGNAPEQAFLRGSGINAIAVSSASPTVAISRAGVTQVLTANKPPAQLPLSALVSNLAFSRDGTFLAAATSSEGQVWRMDTLSAIGLSIVGRIPQARLSGMVFSQSNRYLAAIAGDGSAHVWEWLTGREIATFPRIFAMVNAVAFSPDERHIATTGADGTRVWVWQPDDLIAEGCARVRKPQLDTAVWDKYLPGEPAKATCTAK